MRPRVLEAFFGRRREQFAFTHGGFPHWILIATEEGSFRFELPDEHGTAGFGDLLVCPPQTDLKRHILQHLTHHVIYFTWQDEQGRTAFPCQTPLAGKHSAHDLARLSSNYTLLQMLDGRYDEPARRIQEHLLFDILLLCMGEITGVEAATQQIADEAMARAAHYLHTHLQEPISLKTLAASLGLGSVQFTRRFRQATGVAPNEYLTSLRLQKARTLLMETSATVDEIAKCCGYRSGLYLSRVFQKEFSIRPGRFRRQQKL